jgi:hypothetical protein
MVGVTTVALIERRPDISRSLFGRYWRDVHGVMAARIPGFDSYTQYHVSPIGDAAPFEGIAIVTFASEDDRGGLATSEVTRHIHRDEQNVFRRALLYNLDAEASVLLIGEQATGEQLLFVLTERAATDALIADLRASAPAYLAVHDLRSSDPAAWNDTDVGAVPRFAALVHAGWEGGLAPAPAAGAGIAAYRLDERHVMIERGRPTAVGLRGLDAVRTIEEAGATNQLDPAVVSAVYGAAFAR